jgi:hypothetical protein
MMPPTPVAQLRNLAHIMMLALDVYGRHGRAVPLALVELWLARLQAVIAMLETP